MEAEVAFKIFDKDIVIAQLEIVNASEFIEKNREAISKVLESVKKEKNLSYIFLNCIDILEGYNQLFSINNETEQLLEEIMNIKFENKVAKINKIVMRKEIIKLMKEYEKEN